MKDVLCTKCKCRIREQLPILNLENHGLDLEITIST